MKYNNHMGIMSLNQFTTMLNLFNLKKRLITEMSNHLNITHIKLTKQCRLIDEIIRKSIFDLQIASDIYYHKKVIGGDIGNSINNIIYSTLSDISKLVILVNRKQLIKNDIILLQKIIKITNCIQVQIWDDLNF